MIEGRQISLRLFREEDLDEFLNLQNRYVERGEFYPVAMRSMSTCRKDFLETGWWDEHQGGMLITDKQQRILGSMFFFRGAPYQEGYEVGYTVLKREDRGKGIMSEALPLFSAYLFEAKPMRRLSLLIVPDNVASRKVAEKSGYRYEGTLSKLFSSGGNTMTVRCIRSCGTSARR